MEGGTRERSDCFNPTPGGRVRCCPTLSDTPNVQYIYLFVFGRDRSTQLPGSGSKRQGAKTEADY